MKNTALNYILRIALIALTLSATTACSGGNTGGNFLNDADYRPGTIESTLDQ